MIRVRVKNIGADSLTGSPVLLLENVDNTDEIFPIWIGVPEAENIILHQAGIETPRPLTYDLMKSIIKALDATVDRVAIIDKRNNIYIAEVVLNKNGQEIKVDSRPSDAVNIALRFGVPIYLNEDVVQKINLKDLKESINNKAEEDLNGFEFEKQELPQTDNIMEKPIKSKGASLEDKGERDEIKRFLDSIKPEDFAINPFKNKREKNK